MKTNLRNQRGFTLIELVVVMVILALLAAVAVPKFFDLQKQAEAASVKKVIGNIRSALSLRTAKALVDGDTMAAVVTDLQANGTMAQLLSNEPESYVGTIANVAALNTGEWGDWDNGTHGWIAYKMKNTDIITAKSGSTIFNGDCIIQRVEVVTDSGEDVGLELTPNGTGSYEYDWEY